uniref:Acetylglutamate kinase n=1 Tax=Polysiphonia sertularioides TaxID=945028 RepID=A0A1Z1M9J0_9FLOR|nr:acetylglutamate kinase [Polysiphonia sertularioides]ARW62562.1 acetylglutamate kinase [Polysiphonia sertularioides]
MSNTMSDNTFYFSSEATSLIKNYVGSTFIIKYGGSAMKNETFQYNLIQDISLLYSLGVNIVLVHGGGHIIDTWLEKLNIDICFQDGLRMTDSASIEVIEMVLSGKINKKLVSLFSKNDISATGISGKDGNLVIASSISQTTTNLTGQIDNVNPQIIHTLLKDGFLPIISSLGLGENGETYNINADTFASSLAVAINADKYILVTDTPGILMDITNPNTLIKKINIDQIDRLKIDGNISGGMIPKLDSCVNAVKNNVKSAHIIDGTLKHSLLYELFSYKRVGSMVVL